MKLPPFGKNIQRRANNEIRVYVGSDAWSVATRQITRNKLILPAGSMPDEFTWPVSGYDVLIVACGAILETTVRRLALVLLRHGAKKVVVADDEITIFYPEAVG
jgi:hypothetical protein